MASQVASDRYLDVTRQWFTEAWAGNLALADVLFSETRRTNGVLVGVPGPKRGIQEQPAGLPDLTASIEDMFAAIDNIVMRLVSTVPPAATGAMYCDYGVNKPAASSGCDDAGMIL